MSGIEPVTQIAVRSRKQDRDSVSWSVPSFKQASSRSRIRLLPYPNEKEKALNPAFGIVRRNTCSPATPL
jgi:hypothetical protein